MLSGIEDEGWSFQYEWCFFKAAAQMIGLGYVVIRTWQCCMGDIRWVVYAPSQVLTRSNPSDMHHSTHEPPLPAGTRCHQWSTRTVLTSRGGVPQVRCAGDIKL